MVLLVYSLIKCLGLLAGTFSKRFLTGCWLVHNGDYQIYIKFYSQKKLILIDYLASLFFKLAELFKFCFELLWLYSKVVSGHSQEYILLSRLY
jgi:hypothetical protein